MANRRRGLPTKVKSVTRLNAKTGKLSVYKQNYHVNPFEKTSKKSGAAKSSTLADKFILSMAKRPKMEKRMKVGQFVDQLTPNNGQIGAHAVSKIIDKVKNKNDVNQLKESFFDKVFSEGFFNSDNSAKYKGLLRDTTKLVNNIPQNEHSYSQILSSITGNRSNVTPDAVSSILSAFQDHTMLVNVLRGKRKSEAYESEELLHDFYARHSNPMNHMKMFLGNIATDNAKSCVQTLYSIPNDLTYINNSPLLTSFESKNWEDWIDLNNSKIRESLQGANLFRNILIELDPIVASKMFKSDKLVDIPIYQSTFLTLSGVRHESNMKVIKDLNVDNDTDFMVKDAKFLISDDKKVYLSFNIIINDIPNRDFVSISTKRTDEILDRFNTKLVSNVDESVLSKNEIQNRTGAVIDEFKSINDDTFVMVDI